MTIMFRPNYLKNLYHATSHHKELGIWQTQISSHDLYINTRAE